MNKVAIVSSEFTYERFPRVEAVILTHVARGAGKDHSDPVRSVLQIHRQDGEFLAEADPCPVDVEKLRFKIDHAARLLRHLREIEVLNAADRERIDSFFDPEPIV